MDDNSLYVVLKVYGQFTIGMRGHTRRRDPSGVFLYHNNFSLSSWQVAHHLTRIIISLDMHF